MPSIGDSLSNRYMWIMVTGAFGAFGFGYATGSNDVANAFGTSVGAKTLSLRTAVLLAVIFEFTGALVLGRVSAETIAGGIAKPSAFVSNPPAYAFGMSVVLWLGTILQLIASYRGLNVSATHCIIGGIVGVGMAWGGADAVYWAEPDPSKAPPIKGVVPIILSWFFSPILTACASAVIYGLNVFFVLRSEHSTSRSVYVLPILVFSTVMIDIYFVFTKGAKKSFAPDDDWSDSKAAWISACVAAGCAVLASIIGIPFLRWRIRRKVEQRDTDNANALEAASNDQERARLEMIAQNNGGNFGYQGNSTEISTQPGLMPNMPMMPNMPNMTNMPMPPANQGALVYAGQYNPSGYNPSGYNNNLPLMQQGYNFGLPSAARPYQIFGGNFGNASMQSSIEYYDPVKDANAPIAGPAEEPAKKAGLAKFKDAALRGVNYDIDKAIEEDPVVAAIHANARQWDPDTEYIYGFLQVISAICVIFAHGAGEVGYMAGPLAVIYNVVSNPGNNVVANNSKVTPEIWIILIGAFGLVIGLATYGYKVCAAVGTQMARITPSRGFAAELATSFIIMIAAQLGLPTSSSQCITGGILGVAAFEGAKGINIKFVAQTMASWVVTTVSMALLSAAIFSQAVYAPSRYMEYRHNKNLTLTYSSLCSEYYSCGKDQYLKDCGFKDGDAKTYRAGTCTDCAVAFESKKCAGYQYLKGCGKLSSGSCTNCTTTKCDSGFMLEGCSLLSAGKCVKKA